MALVVATARLQSCNSRNSAGTADESVTVVFNVSILDGHSNRNGSFIVEVHPEWAPRGAARFVELVESSFFDGASFFRVITSFVAQFGIAADPGVTARWIGKDLQDEPVIQSNKRGFLSFATSGPNSRGTQIFINLVDNTNLDGMNFTPFARVVDGMSTVDRLYSGYGESGPVQRGMTCDPIYSNDSDIYICVCVSMYGAPALLYLTVILPW